MSEKELIAEVEALLAKFTSYDKIFAHYLPSQGWAVCWRRADQIAPICHMRWTDGLNPEIETRLKNEYAVFAAAPELLRRLVEEVKQTRADLKQTREDRDELSNAIEACHKMFDELDPEIEEGMTSLTPLETRLREHLFPGDIITDDMVNGDD